MARALAFLLHSFPPTCLVHSFPGRPRPAPVGNEFFELLRYAVIFLEGELSQSGMLAWTNWACLGS